MSSTPVQNMLVYTVSQKEVPTFKFSVTLSNVNQFTNFLHCWKAYEICYKIYMTLPTSLIGMLQCKNFENQLGFDKVTESLKVGLF